MVEIADPLVLVVMKSERWEMPRMIKRSDKQKEQNDKQFIPRAQQCFLPVRSKSSYAGKFWEHI